MYNWCWGKWSWFKPPYSVMFKTSCNKHDEYYDKWGNAIDRKIADVYLLEYIKLDIRENKCIIQIIYFYIWAYIYYIWVRLWWGKYFNYKK